MSLPLCHCGNFCASEASANNGLNLRYKLNICKDSTDCPRQFVLMKTGDVGGQKTLRSYWRNYFEKTDALIWVVDATDRLRIEDCREELHGLLLEEVCCDNHVMMPSTFADKVVWP